MGALFAKIWKGVQAVIGLILPRTFGKLTRQIRRAPDELAGDLTKPKAPGGGFGRGLLTVLALLILIGILVGLYFISGSRWFRQFIRVDNAFVPFYLPALAVLIYGLVWLGWYLSKLLAAEEEVSAYPDIDSAWSEALEGLERAGIGGRSA